MPVVDVHPELTHLARGVLPGHRGSLAPAGEQHGAYTLANGRPIFRRVPPPSDAELADALDAVFEDTSVSEIFQGQNQS